MEGITPAAGINYNLNIAFMEQALAPIVIFTYKRLDTLQKTISSLKSCELSAESDLIIFSDGPKSEKDVEKVQTVRNNITQIGGFKSITLNLSDQNKGLAKSIIEGVTQVLKTYDSVIVLEDDLLLSDNFLLYMNACLKKYKNNKMCFSISGYSFKMPIPSDYDYDVYFTMRHCSWGWAMWKDRWDEIDWDVKDYEQFSSSLSLQRSFNKIGSDLASSLKSQQQGEVNSWAIRCVYFQFKKQTYTVYPTVSKVQNIGFNGDATHTRQRYNKFVTDLEDHGKVNFNLPDDMDVDQRLLKVFTNKFGLRTRAFYKILNLFTKNND
jgi:glycosyltransferase involved in cell wall biosynthesis